MCVVLFFHLGIQLERREIFSIFPSSTTKEIEGFFLYKSKHLAILSTIKSKNIFQGKYLSREPQFSKKAHYVQLRMQPLQIMLIYCPPHPSHSSIMGGGKSGDFWGFRLASDKMVDSRREKID